jgi:hypothetical protein
MTLSNQITPQIRYEILALLKQIPNPKRVKLAPTFDPNYKYYLLEDGTYRMVKRTFLSSGKFN